MARKIALLFAGQGAQSVGMGRELAGHHPAAGELFQEADQILGRSLSGIAWNGPLEELTKTSNCQPALYVHGLACLAALRSAAGDFAVELAVSLAKEHGIRRATLLNVAGAYHSRLMNSAYEQLAAPLLEATLQVPRFPVMSNVTGGPVESLPEIRRALQDQVTSTVRWTE